MKIEALGHVVIKVSDQQRAEAFYHGVLGIPIAARNVQPPMTFFSLGNHHDFAILALGETAQKAPHNAVGLYHVAFKIGDDISALKEAKAQLEAAGITCSAVDHDVTKSLYFTDPDNNMVEVYVDASDAWKQEPQRVAHGAPLAI